MLLRLLRHKAFLVGLVLFGFIVLIAVFADLIAPSDPARMAIRNRFKPPSFEHPLGCSQLSRIVYGARLSLAIGFAVVILMLCSSYARRSGRILQAAGQHADAHDPDALMAFPAALAIAIAAALGASSLTAAIALSAVYIPRTARIVRASVLWSGNGVRAAPWRMGRAHLAHPAQAYTAQLPCPIVQLTFIFAYAILSEAVLSFLELRRRPPRGATSWPRGAKYT